MVFLRDGVLRAEYHGRNGDNVRELDVNVGVVFDNGEWREVGRSFEQYNLTSCVISLFASFLVNY